MSRSYRKNPIRKSHDGGKEMKRIASKAVRRQKELPLKGSSYKKIFNSWNLNYYISYWPLEEAIEAWYEEENKSESYRHFHKRYKTLENFLNWWKKEMFGK